MPHAQLVAGAEAVDPLVAEGLQLNFSNQRAANCAAYYDRLEHCVEAGITDDKVLATCLKDP